MGTDSEHLLAGERIAFTGRLASMPREEAIELLNSAGAEHSPTVTTRTTILVVGDEGWPLKADGRLTRKLQTARRLRRDGCEIQTLTEEQFLGRLRIADSDRTVRNSYTAVDLHRLLGLRRETLRSWQRAGLIEPVTSENGITVYGFHQVTRLRSLMVLLEAGTSLQRIRRSLQQLRHRAPDRGELPDWLNRIQRDGKRLVVTTSDGELCEPHGQRLFAFDDQADAESPTVGFFLPPADDLFEEAVRLEEAADYAGAAATYQQLLDEDGPDSDVCLNLGNVLYSLGRRAEAAEQFRQAVELDPEFAEAWLNLGNVLAEGGQHETAVAAFQRALAIDPQYRDVHYGLADALDELGRDEDARRHWLIFLHSEADGEWADYARSRVAGWTA